MPAEATDRFTPLSWQEAYKRNEQRVLDFYDTSCFDWRPAWEKRQEKTQVLLGEQALHEWKSFLEPYVQDEALLAPIEELGKPETTVVITGQQAVAGMGPMLAIYKIFAARHWATKIAQETGKPCIPLYWIASDDHDLAEVATAAWLRQDGMREEFALTEEKESTRPVFDATITAERAKEFEKVLRDTTVASEFQEGILSEVMESLAGEKPTFETHVLHLFCRWLLPMGIIPVVPRLNFIRAGGADVFRREIEQPGSSTRLMMKQGDKLGTAGIQPPLHRAGNEVNFFLETQGARGKVTFENGEFIVSNPAGDKSELARFSAKELNELLEEQPNRFSPNAALRPLVQDNVFPSVAYIAGPTELVYHGQISTLYNHFNVKRPAVMPRPNVVFTERKIDRAMEKLGVPAAWVTLPSAAAFEEKLNEQSAEQMNDSGWEEKLQGLHQSLDALEQSLVEEQKDPAVKKSLEKLRSQVQTGSEKLHERLQHHYRTRDTQKENAREKVKAYLYPGGQLQERAMGPLSPLLIQFGPQILSKLQEVIKYDAEGIQAGSLSDL